MATAGHPPNSASPPTAGPSGIQHFPSPAHTLALDFLFNTPAKLPIQEGDKPEPKNDLDLIDPSDPELNLIQALQLLANKIGGMPL